MKIIIDIDEELYNDMKSLKFTTFSEDIIIKGKPLPIGHGDLIDASKINFENADFDTYADYCRAFDAIDQAEPIIPADKEENKMEKELKWTNEDAIKMLKSKMDGSVDTSYEWAETVRLAINALEERANAQPCEDAISRVDALNAVTMASVRSEAIENIELIPNTYQRMTGRIAGMKKKHDGCVNCRFEEKKEHEEPCRRCSHNYVDKWRAKE